MDETIEKMRRMRRKRALKHLTIFFIISLVFVIISPLVSMFIGLLITGAGAYGMSPTMEMYRGFKSSAALSVISKDSAENIYKIETKELTKRSHYSDMVVVIIMGFSVFIISIVLMGLGWNGFL